MLAIWKLYNWVCRLLYFTLDLCPMFLRIFIFRLWLGGLGKHPNLIDYGTYFRYPKKIRIGSHVAINRGCTFLAVAQSQNKYDIVIGDNCVFAPNVKFLSGGHDYSSTALPITSSPIYVEDYVWIGAGAIILQGVRIGTGGVVGAGSVVTHDVPPWTVWAGNPARQIGIRKIMENRETGNR